MSSTHEVCGNGDSRLVTASSVNFAMSVMNQTARMMYTSQACVVNLLAYPTVTQTSYLHLYLLPPGRVSASAVKYLYLCDKAQRRFVQVFNTTRLAVFMTR